MSPPILVNRDSNGPSYPPVIDETIEEISDDESTIDYVENTVENIRNNTVKNIKNIKNVKTLNVNGYSSSSWGAPY